MIQEIGFALDSPLEEDGFELSVPRKMHNSSDVDLRDPGTAIKLRGLLLAAETAETLRDPQVPRDPGEAEPDVANA